MPVKIDGVTIIGDTCLNIFATLFWRKMYGVPLAPTDIITVPCSNAVYASIFVWECNRVGLISWRFVVAVAFVVQHPGVPPGPV